MYVYLQRGKETIPLIYPGLPRDITNGPRKSVEGFLKINVNPSYFLLNIAYFLKLFYIFLVKQAL